MQDSAREELGRVVRQAWVAYCISISDTKPAHIAPWDALTEADREADRVIGEAVAQYLLAVIFTPEAGRFFAPETDETNFQ